MFSYSINTSIRIHAKHDIPTGIGTKTLNSESDDINFLFLASCIYVSNISVLQFSHMKRSVNEIRCYHMSLTFWYSLACNGSFLETSLQFLLGVSFTSTSSFWIKSMVLKEDLISFHFRVYFDSLRSLKYLEIIFMQDTLSKIGHF